MKHKIFNGLKQTYSNLGLSNEILQAQAEALEALGFVTDKNLATVIQGQKTFLTSLQSGIDRRVTDAVVKAGREALAKPESPTPPGSPASSSSGLTAEEVTQIVAKQIKPLAQAVRTIQTQTSAEKRNTEASTQAKQPALPDCFISILHLPTDTNLENYFKGVEQRLANIALGRNNNLG